MSSIPHASSPWQRWFKLHSHHTTVQRECLAGTTTFLTMVYITVVNPGILSDAGMDFGAVFVATCLAAAIGSILMGLLGNYPVAQAPGMGQNAFFTYTVVLGMGFTWQTALGAVFLSGLIFIALSILPVREWLINSIPTSLKLGIAAGIGLFLGFLGLQNSGVVVANPATMVSLGELAAWGPVICLISFVTMVVLAARGVTGAVIVGITVGTVLGIVSGQAEFQGIVSRPPSLSPVWLQLDLAGAFQLSMLTVILTFLIVDVFDTAGTMVGVANRAGLVDAQGRLPRLRGALLADSTATASGALLGTSSTTSYIESAAGVAAGGRTGLTAVFCGLLFLGCLFFAPLAQTVPAYATAAALLYIACLMVSSLRDLNWDDVTEATPAVIAALAMPLTFSITEGVAFGFISYALIKLLSGRATECPTAVYLFAVLFMLKYAFLS